MHKTGCCLITALCLLAFIDLLPGVCLAGDGSEEAILHEGVVLKLTKDFYEALRAEGGRGVRTYSNDPSQGYLKEISVSTRFMVETNLQVLRQQERIIRLLEDLSSKRKK